jgi:hypothetical protein
VVALLFSSLALVRITRILLNNVARVTLQCSRGPVGSESLMRTQEQDVVVDAR